MDEGTSGFVKNKLEVHCYKRKLKNLLRRIEDSDIDGRSKKLILEFYSDCLIRGLSKARIVKYLDTLERIARFFKKSFDEITKDDVAEFIRSVEESNYSEWTKRDYKLILKIFFKWLKNSEDYPEEVSWIKTRVRNSNMFPEGLLTEEEVKRLVKHAANLRDRALILTLYESGCRIGELLSLRIRNVQFDDYGAVLIVNGKTGSRRVRIIESAPVLASWMENHPLRDDPNAPLWVNLSTRNRYHALTYEGAKAILKRTAKRAGLKKRIYPHLFRHSRATRLANVLTEAQLKQLFGWVQDSRMAATYVHLSGRDVDNALLKLHGMKVDAEGGEEKFTVIVCPRCGNKNSPTSKFCNACGLCLDLETALKIDEVRAKADRLMSELIKNPKVLDALLEGIKKLRVK